MAPRVLGRDAERSAIRGFLREARSRPIVLSVRGEAGIGKSTLLHATMEEAAGQGFAVLSCACDSTETQLSYAGLTDVLRPLVDGLPALPEPQRFALEAALLHRTQRHRAPDVHAVCAGTLSLLTRACADGAVLLAIDDLQWLDHSSARAFAFTVRRCREPFALVTTLREGHDGPAEFRPWDGADGTRSLSLVGLELAPLHALLAGSVGPIERPTMQHIAAVSRGNPLFAQELARRLCGSTGSPPPSELSGGMRSRLAELPAPTREALLVCSAVPAPTARLLARAEVPDATSALVPAELAGIVVWDGDRLRFSHPMWREVTYRAVSADRRRDVHRRLSQAVVDIEERARHLALSSPLLDPETTTALTAAASAARSRGAPAQAADMLELALERGAEDPALRLQAAADHLAGGRPEAARTHARRLVEELPNGAVRAGALSLLGEITFMVDDYPAAVGFLVQAYADADEAPAIQVAAAIDLAFAYSNVGDNNEGLLWALRAEAAAASAGEPALAAEATGAAAVMQFLTGAGVDQDRIDRALADEDVDRGSSPTHWPSMSAGLVQLWSSDLERARTTLAAVRQRCTDRGLERGLFLLLPRIAETAMLQGDAAGAEAYVSELEERAGMGGGESVLATARSVRVVLTARGGDVDAAGRAYAALQEIADGDRHLLVSLIAVAALGSCQLAAGQFDAAATSLEPVGLTLLAIGLGEPVMGRFVADCIDVAAATGRVERATALVEMLERWAARAGTRWPEGVSARGRAVIALHRDSLAEAATAIERSIVAFDAPGLSYERARTLLVASHLHRRRRERASARDCLLAAEAIFTEVGAHGWGAHARRELAQLGLQRGAEADLTPSERRIAELAATGQTNAAMAARLAVSPKTVEAHLSRIYRKLGIRSRAELGRWIASADRRTG